MLKDEELIRCTVRAFDHDHTYARQLLTEDTQREEPPALQCRSVDIDLPVVDDAVVASFAANMFKLRWALMSQLRAM